MVAIRHLVNLCVLHMHHHIWHMCIFIQFCLVFFYRRVKVQVFYELCHFMPNNVLQMLLLMVISCMPCTVIEMLCETAGVSIVNLLLHYVVYDASIKKSIAVVKACCLYDYLWCLLLQRV